MNKYVEHIEELLYLHDCVIVPGFGGFICDYTSANINEKTGTIVPPSKKVVFNKHLKQNDGLLIDWIARKEQIDYEKAQRRLALFCEEIKVRLNQKQKVDFGTIGTFSVDRRFNVLFESKNHNFLPATSSRSLRAPSMWPMSLSLPTCPSHTRRMSPSST